MADRIIRSSLDLRRRGRRPSWLQLGLGPDGASGVEKAAFRGPEYNRTDHEMKLYKEAARGFLRTSDRSKRSLDSIHRKPV